MDIRKQIYEFIEMYVDTTEPKKLCSSIQDLVEELAESKVKNITVTRSCCKLKDKPTQTFDEFITGICKNRGITLINNYTKETIGLDTLIEKWKITNT